MNVVPGGRFFEKTPQRKPSVPHNNNSLGKIQPNFCTILIEIDLSVQGHHINQTLNKDMNQTLNKVKYIDRQCCFAGDASFLPYWRRFFFVFFCR